MDRFRKVMPMGNKACYDRHVKKNQERHRQRLASMKCSIDCAPPRRFPHLERNQKKEQLMEERYAEIEKDNRLLLERMSYILKCKGMDCYATPHMKLAHSLTRDERRRDMDRITRDNQLLLRRIQQAEPTYDHLAFAEDARRHEEYLRNICELPVAIGLPRASQGKRSSGRMG
uniref:Uncharacterized protein n=1 Tax=Rhizochromulina marina TaxID=1034831 RepID=A0A7S2WX22_9STRA|mmetsp:Transcript_9589/g.27187  ORF Transcript_9589/g.27187 Transcript_9589/m.27187 type:complete len:173 (+) Transcript_9589:28-546(+)